MSQVKFTVGDPEKDFFEQNPHWRYLDSSQKLVKMFSADLVSKLRWAVFMVEDPDSKFYRYLKPKRVELVNNNYLKDIFTLHYDPETMKIVNEDIGFLFSQYGRETMSKVKKDYYEREFSYQLLVQQERECTNLKDKADVQLKLSKIYSSLEEAREAFEKENMEERTRSRGREQRGILFNGD